MASSVGNRIHRLGPYLLYLCACRDSSRRHDLWLDCNHQRNHRGGSEFLCSNLVGSISSSDWRITGSPDRVPRNHTSRCRCSCMDIAFRCFLYRLRHPSDGGSYASQISHLALGTPRRNHRGSSRFSFMGRMAVFRFLVSGGHAWCLPGDAWLVLCHVRAGSSKSTACAERRRLASSAESHGNA